MAIGTRAERSEQRQTEVEHRRCHPCHLGLINIRLQLAVRAALPTLSLSSLYNSKVLFITSLNCPSRSILLYILYKLVNWVLYVFLSPFLSYKIQISWLSTFSKFYTRESSSKQMVQDITVIKKTGAVVTNSWFGETLLGRGDGDLFWLINLILKATLWGRYCFHVILLMVKLKQGVVHDDIK